MKCKDIEQLLIPFLQQALDPGEMDEVHRHTAGCPACTEQLGQTSAMLESLAQSPPPPFDADRGLTDLRARISALDAPRIAQPGWRQRLRWYLAPVAVGAAAAAALAIWVAEPSQDAVQEGTPHTTHAVKQVPGVSPTDGPSSQDQLAQVLDLLEDFTLYENLECFQEYDALAALLDEDEQQWDELMREVEG